MTSHQGPTSERPAPASVVERTVLLDADVDQVLEALSSPDLLSAWLGEWNADDDDHATVVTDDGVLRTVERRPAGAADEICWRWSPTGEPSQWSDVRFTVTTDGDRTRLTVTESLAPAACAAGLTAPAVPWLGSLIALGAVLAVGSLVAV
jgi:uncharacterized protein YndB with AHSA1/START domain